MFVDKVRITVIGGRGGDGAVAFHREKYVAAGGPDGGDGGHGGSVILRVNDHMTTLLDFRYKCKYQAGAGANGQGRNMAGKRGEPLVIQVPRGTVVRDAETNQIIVDMSTGEDFVIAKGGRGGWGNSHYATATRQIPRFAKSGRKGEERDVILELKLLADVGLVGFPNVGKSTLLSVTSNARPKIANYHFTTLFPNLGVIYVDEGVSFVMADIPGIIEGAAEGAGLGHDFLRHIDRCRLLVHVVDVSGSEGRDPVEDFDAICEELKNYSVDLSNRPMIVAANKVDLLMPESDNLERLRARVEEAGCELYEISAGTTQGTKNRPMIVAANKVDLLMPESDNLERLRARVEEAGCELYEISAGTTQGTKNLMRVVAQRLSTLPPVTIYEPEYVAPVAAAGTPEELEIDHYGNTWLITGKWLENLIMDINFDDYEARNHFDLLLRRSGLFARLEEMGIQDGDTVDIYDFQFEYQR